MGDAYLNEIMEQPQALRRMWDRWRGDRALADLGRKYRDEPGPLLFVGMGSSNYAPVAVRARLSRAGVPFRVAEAGELVHYELGGVDAGTWLIAVSQSGESYETRVAVERLRGHVRRVVAITNEPQSSLASLADNVLLLEAGAEAGSTTKTFMNTVLALHLLVDQLAGPAVGVAEADIEGCIRAVEACLADGRERAAEMAAALGVPGLARESEAAASGADGTGARAGVPEDAGALHLIARGPTLAAAHQSGLILAETTDLFTQSLAGGSFRHGPYELAGPAHRAVILAPGGRTQHLLLQLAAELAERGSRVALLTDAAASPFSSLYHWPMPKVSEDLAPILYFLPMELFGWHVARMRGRTPGMMRNMAKVTNVE
ncbi:MAG: SIS domain-containing protein [Alicyclobacillus sp.]|nr:SIS domain-containing protein [Alicyclobacillus sp.]